MNMLEAFAQGARCGHIEGKGRAGQYVIGEEEILSWDAAKAQGLGFPLEGAWSRGYMYGYCRAAEGSALPSDARLQRIAEKEGARHARAK